MSKGIQFIFWIGENYKNKLRIIEHVFLYDMFLQLQIDQ